MPFDKKISTSYKLSGKTKFSMASCSVYVTTHAHWAIGINKNALLKNEIGSSFTAILSKIFMIKLNALGIFLFRIPRAMPSRIKKGISFEWFLFWMLF